MSKASPESRDWGSLFPPRTVLPSLGYQAPLTYRQDGSVCSWVGGDSSSLPLSRAYVANSQHQGGLQLALLTLPLGGFKPGS